MTTVTLDRERPLIYRMEAVCRLQQEHGVNLLELMAGDVEWWLDPTVLRAVLWCGLIADDPDLTVEAVGGLFGMENIVVVVRAIVAAVGGEQRANPPTASAA